MRDGFMNDLQLITDFGFTVTFQSNENQGYSCKTYKLGIGEMETNYYQTIRQALTVALKQVRRVL